MSAVTLENQGKVAVLTMNYKKENRFSPELLAELMEALDRVEKDPASGALVVTGGDVVRCGQVELWLEPGEEGARSTVSPSETGVRIVSGGAHA